MTMPSFKSLVIMENFLCVSRPYLIQDRKTKLFCNFVSIIVTLIITSIIIRDLVMVEHNLGIRIFEAVVGIELFIFSFASRLRKGAFDSIEMLDSKCGVDEEYTSRIQAMCMRVSLLTLPSFVFDFIGLLILGVETSVAVFLCVAFTAHDAEMGFFSIIVETMNIRIERLKNVIPNTGSRIYRHVLMATDHLGEQFTSRILLLLGVTLITTVAYEFILILANSDRILYLTLYLSWREARSMYSLWMMCSAVARTTRVCDDLEYNLVGRLIRDKNINIEKNEAQYKTMQRWYFIVTAKRPQYISGSILSIGFSTPIHVLDLSINYMLIMVQMYLAYK